MEKCYFILTILSEKSDIQFMNVISAKTSGAIRNGVPVVIVVNDPVHVTTAQQGIA